MTSHHVLIWGAIICMPLAAACMAPVAHAQTEAHPTDHSAAPPMVKPPAAVPGAASATNPDNMPVKKPKGAAANDKMMRSDPASAAKAK